MAAKCKLIKNKGDLMRYFKLPSGASESDLKHAVFKKTYFGAKLSAKGVEFFESKWEEDNSEYLSFPFCARDIPRALEIIKREANNPKDEE